MVVEVADVAALPVRDRILARVRVIGLAYADREDPRLLRVRPRSVVLEESGITACLGPGEFLGARPDPFGCREASLLSHLVASHPEFLDELTWTLDPRDLQGVVRVWPLRLDRFGLVLRLEYARRHRDVRLPFAVSVRTTDDARAQLRALAAEAGRRRRACGSRGVEPRQGRPVARREVVAELMRVGWAAAALCSPGPPGPEADPRES